METSTDRDAELHDVLGQDDGLIGDPTDLTPNEHYTMPGVLADLPTPETTQGRGQIPQPNIDDEDDWPGS